MDNRVKAKNGVEHEPTTVPRLRLVRRSHQPAARRMLRGPAAVGVRFHAEVRGGTARAQPRLPQPIPKQSDDVLPPGEPFLSTIRGRIAIGVGVALVLGGAILILTWAKAQKVDPVEVRALLQAELEQINRLPVDRILDKDELVHSILENEIYQAFGGKTYRQIEHTHEALHAQVELEKKARARLKPFLSRYEALKANPTRMKREAPRFYDEARALRDQFSATLYGQKILPVIQDLRQTLEGSVAR